MFKGIVTLSLILLLYCYIFIILLHQAWLKKGKFTLLIVSKLLQKKTYLKKTYCCILRFRQTDAQLGSVTVQDLS